jgi:hypothetical protein
MQRGIEGEFRARAARLANARGWLRSRARAQLQRGLTASCSPAILRSMRPRPLFRLQAFLLVALTGVLGTGVPSHHHERSDVGPILVDGGYHGHGTQLVDPGDRQTSELVVVALPAAATSYVGEAQPALSVAPLPAPRPVARGQPPPSDRPRAPPVSV